MSVILNRISQHRSLFDRVGKNIRWNVVSEVGAKGLLFLAMIYLARSLGAEKYGIFTLAHISVTYAWLFVNLGISMYGPREVAKHPEHSISILSVLFSIRLTSGLLVLILFMAGTLAFTDPGEFRSVFIAFSFYLLIRAIYSEWYLKGKEKFNYLAIGNLVTFSFFFLGVYFFVNTGEDLIKASWLWTSAYLLGACILLAFVVITNHGEFFPLNFKLNDWSTHLRKSLYFSISGGLSVIYQYIPILLLGIGYGNSVAGVFSATHKLIVYCTFVLSIISLAIYPVLARFYVEDIKKLKQLLAIAFVILSILSTTVALIAALFSKEIAVFLLGEDYSSGYIVLMVMSVYLVFRVLRELLVLAVCAVGLQSKTIYAFVVGLVVLLVLFAWFWQFGDSKKVLLTSSIAVAGAELVVFAMTVRIWLGYDDSSNKN